MKPTAFKFFVQSQPVFVNQIEKYLRSSEHTRHILGFRTRGRTVASFVSSNDLDRYKIDNIFFFFNATSVKVSAVL